MTIMSLSSLILSTCQYLARMVRRLSTCGVNA